MEVTEDDSCSSRYTDIDGDLEILDEYFAFGEVHSCRFLPAGLMNGNWRLQTSEGVFALKRIVDVSLPLAQRNLAVLAELANAGAPVARPLATSSGEALAEIEDRRYCLIPWIDGDHVPGTALTVDQAADLGAALGNIHQHLNSEQTTPLLPPGPQQMTSPVTTVAAAHAEADRFLAAIASIAYPTSFDAEAALALGVRKLLLDKYGAEHPRTEIATGPIGWTHGDMQHRNLIWRSGKIAGVIDWDRIRIRPFGEEVARTATVQFGAEDGFLDLERTAAFVAGYRSVLPMPRAALADAVERLWWKRMSDYWQLVFHYDRNDHYCDHLFLPAERLLSWWTERREEVQEAFAAMP